MNYRNLNQELFKVDERQVEVFIKEGDPFSEFEGYVHLLEFVNSQDFSKK